MSPPTGHPDPYHVSYSGQVRTELKELLIRAVSAGLGQQTLEAVKTIDYRLHIYPQFGDPLRDLVTEGETL